METSQTANHAEKVKVELKSTAAAYCALLEDFDSTNSARLASSRKGCLSPFFLCFFFFFFPESNVPVIKYSSG